jgi:hypothetical protein
MASSQSQNFRDRRSVEAGTRSIAVFVLIALHQSMAPMLGVVLAIDALSLLLVSVRRS